MKKIKIKIYNTCLLIATILVCFSSCLKSDLEELETYDGTDITNVRFEYRWYDKDINQLRIQSMNVSQTIDADEKLVECIVTVPATSTTFTEQVRSQVALTNLSGNLTLSTVARVTPLNGAPVLGTIADFSSKEFRYLITAADEKNKAEWTIRITNFIK